FDLGQLDIKPTLLFGRLRFFCLPLEGNGSVNIIAGRLLVQLLLLLDFAVVLRNVLVGPTLRVRSTTRQTPEAPARQQEHEWDDAVKSAIVSYRLHDCDHQLPRYGKRRDGRPRR